MPKALGGLVLALVWLTRLPVGRFLPANPPELARAAWAFPLVGAILGTLAAAIYGLAIWLGLTTTLAALLAIAVLVWATGGLHEDGLADFADGMGGRTPERRLEIMRDSRIGSYGVLTLGLVSALRVAALAALPPQGAVAALFVAPVLSRAGMVLAMAMLSPARRDGLGKGAGRPSSFGVSLALIIAAAAILGLSSLGLGALIAVLLAGVAAQFYVQRLAQKRLGGLTGDVLGAVQQAQECAILIAFAAAFAQKL